MPNIEFEDGRLVRFTWDMYIGRKMEEVIVDFDMRSLTLSKVEAIIMRVVQKCGYVIPERVTCTNSDLEYYMHMISSQHM